MFYKQQQPKNVFNLKNVVVDFILFFFIKALKSNCTGIIIFSLQKAQIIYVAKLIGKIQIIKKNPKSIDQLIKIVC